MRRSISLLLLSLGMGFCHYQIVQSPWGDRIELFLVDLWTSARGPIEAPTDVVLLSMDEASYSALGIPMDQAWPRAIHAKMLNRLHELGAKRAVMDVLFLGRGSNPVADQELIDAMKVMPTVLGADTGAREQGVGQGKYVVEELLVPHEPFAEVAERVALVKMPEKDGYVRQFIIPRSHLTKDMPTLYEAAAGVSHADRDIPKGDDIVWYYGTPGAIPTYAYYRLFDTEHPLPPETFKNKIVFVGLNLRTGVGPMQKDTFKVPFREINMFGVEIQATAAANVLEGVWVHRESKQIEGLFISLATVGLTFLVCAFTPFIGLGALIGISLLWSLFSYQAFIHGFFVPGIILVGFTLPVSYLCSSTIYYLLTYRAQRAVEKAFSLYLPPEMAKQMRGNSKGLQLGGEDVRATALFTDIAGFTTIAEGMTASQVAQMLNHYFTEVMNVVFDNKGTLIKFIGDAVFVIWGAPIKVENHARLACETAVAINKEVQRFNASNRFPPLHTRVGVHTGQMVVGNLGSAKRFDYTAIGDAVNLAARIEGLNKMFGTSVLISEETLKEIGDSMASLPLGKIRAVGKTESVGLYTLLDEPLPINSPLSEQSWRLALTKFEDREWDEAKSLFKQFAEEPGLLQKAAKLYLKELSAIDLFAPPEGWKGELVAESK